MTKYKFQRRCISCKTSILWNEDDKYIRSRIAFLYWIFRYTTKYFVCPVCGHEERL